MNPTEKQLENQYLLYDADDFSQFSLKYFCLQSDQLIERMETQAQRPTAQAVTSGGRGSSFYISIDGQACVLRHYLRGGWVASLTKDAYWWHGIQNTRAWREWYLLTRLLNMQLPVPIPVAARVIRTSWVYRADIITRRIVDAQTLAQCLMKRSMDAAFWRQIGVVIRHFHRYGVCHADLNAHNIMISQSEEIYLIDFDKAEIRSISRSWQDDNLARLQRSLHKLKDQINTFNFTGDNWTQLMAGYTQV